MVSSVETSKVCTEARFSAGRLVVLVTGELTTVGAGFANIALANINSYFNSFLY